MRAALVVLFDFVRQSFIALEYSFDALHTNKQRNATNNFWLSIEMHSNQMTAVGRSIIVG